MSIPYGVSSKVSASATVALLVLMPSSTFAAQKNWQNYLVEGETKLAQGNLLSAEASFNKALTAVKAVFHSDLDLVTCQNKLANVLALENKTGAAEAGYRRSLNLIEQQYGKKSANLLQSLFALGSIYESVGEHNLAAKYYSRAIAINESHFSGLSPGVVFDAKLSVKSRRALDSRGTYQSGKANASTLAQEPGLVASKALVDQLGDFNQDLLKQENNSDQELISEFQNEMSKCPANTIATSRATLHADE